MNIFLVLRDKIGFTWNLRLKTQIIKLWSYRKYSLSITHRSNIVGEFITWITLESLIS